MNPIIMLKKTRLNLLLLLILFKLSLDLAYVFIIFPIYAYSGFTLSIDLWALIESYVLVLIIGIIVPICITRPSHFLIWMLAIAPVVPTLSYYAMHSGSRTYVYAIFISFICVVLISKLPLIRIGTLKEGRKIGITVLIVIVTVAALSLLTKGGLSHFNLDLSQVYVHRAEVGELINTGVWGYLNTWVFKVINPALIGWALWRKSYKLLMFFLSLQVLFFGISSQKSVLFYPVLILGVYYLFKKKRVFEYMMWGLISVVAVSSLASFVLDYHWLSTLFVRRVFFVPAQLNFAYYDLFSNIGHVYLSNSILSQFIHYPFEYGYTNMISQYLFGQTNTNCNNGFLATSYMHFGYLGMLLFSIIVGLLLCIVDSLVYKRIPLWLGISIVMIPFFSMFTSADLSTSLLTHGIFVSFLVLLIIGNKEENLL